MKPFISVVIPTFQGADRIQKVLKSLESQTCLPDETIVVIDGSNDGTIEILDNWKTLIGLKAIYQENKGRSGARNTGANYASGKLLVFFDDDINVKNDCIAKHKQIHLEYPNAIIAGQIFESTDIKNEFTKYKSFISRHWTKNFDNRPTVLNAEQLFLSAANMSISKIVFEDLTGFDNNLSDGEDFDLAVRAFVNDYNVIFSPELIGYHHSFQSFREYIDRQRQYRKSYKQLFAAKKDLSYADLYKKYIVAISPIKKHIYTFISPKMVTIADKEYFKFLPKKIKYAIYKRMVSALSIYFPEKKL